MAANRIFCCQGNTAQHDEDKDEIGEDVVIDEPVASHSNSGEETQQYTVCAYTPADGQYTTGVPVLCQQRPNRAATSSYQRCKCWSYRPDFWKRKSIQYPVPLQWRYWRNRRGFPSSYRIAMGYECHGQFQRLYHCAHTEANVKRTDAR